MKINVLLLLAVLVLPACSTVNETLSCNETAGDSCLTMDEVNAMTEEKGVYVRKKVFKSGPFTNQDPVRQANRDGLWIAGQEDKENSHA